MIPIRYDFLGQLFPAIEEDVEVGTDVRIAYALRFAASTRYMIERPPLLKEQIDEQIGDDDVRPPDDDA